MLTTAITGAIAGVLAWCGISPGPYLAAIWIVVKILIVAAIAAAGALGFRKKPQSSPTEG